MNYSHIIWDWNGTLYNDAPACVNTLNIILENRGLPAVTLQEYRDIFGFPVKSYYEVLGFDFEKEDWDAMAKEFHDVYADAAREMQLRDGITDLLSTLKETDVPMSVLSASETGILEHYLKQYGIIHFFKHITGLSDIYAGSKVKAGKNLVRKIGIPPSEILMIGDTIHDYEVACEMKCDCVLLAGGHQSTERLEKCGCGVITTFSDLLTHIG